MKNAGAQSLLLVATYLYVRVSSVDVSFRIVCFESNDTACDC